MFNTWRMRMKKKSSRICVCFGIRCSLMQMLVNVAHENMRQEEEAKSLIWADEAKNLLCELNASLWGGMNDEALDATRKALWINICEQTDDDVRCCWCSFTLEGSSYDHMPRSQPHLACRALAESDCEQWNVLINIFSLSKALPSLPSAALS